MSDINIDYNQAINILKFMINNNLTDIYKILTDLIVNEM